MDIEKIRRRLQIIRKAISEEDIDRLYGEDQMTLEMIKNVASSEIPGDVDVLVEDGLSGIDADFAGLDVPEKELVRVLVHTARISGTKVKLNVLMTEVGELVARAETAAATFATAEATLIRGCPDCGQQLDGDPNICPNCGWKSDNPI